MFQCIGMGVNNFIRTAGAPNRALGTMIIGAVSCTIFNFLFVMVLGWGVQGSALATVCGQAISCATVLWYFTITKNVPMKLHLRFMPLHTRTVRLILSLGLASFAVQAGMAVVNFVLNNLLNMYGAMSPLGAEGALASIGVVQRVAMFSVLPLIGMSIAIQPLLGFNFGAHLFERVKKTLWYGIFGATAIGVVLWSLVHLFPEQIVGFFGITNETLRDFTVFALKVQLLMLPFIGFQIVGSNYFQATGSAAQVHLPVADASDSVPRAAAHRAADGAPGLVPAVHQPRCAVLRPPHLRLPGHLHHRGIHHLGDGTPEEARERRAAGEVLSPFAAPAALIVTLMQTP